MRSAFCAWLTSPQTSPVFTALLLEQFLEPQMYMNFVFLIFLLVFLELNIYLNLLQQWRLGRIICDIYLSVDYMVSNASAWNLVVISLDRYFSVTRPLTYRARRTTRKAAMMIAGAWLLSAVIWLPSVYAWPYIGTVHVLIMLFNMVS